MYEEDIVSDLLLQHHRTIATHLGEYGMLVCELKTVQKEATSGRAVTSSRWNSRKQKAANFVKIESTAVSCDGADFLSLRS